MAENALAFSSVDVAYRIRGTARKVLRGLSFHIERGEAYGLVGESGCGKSTAAFAAVRYLPRNGEAAGRIEVNGQDLMSMGARELRSLRQTTVAMVYQDPGRALNPSMRIGRQIAEIFELGGLARGAMSRSAEMLDRVRISDPQRVMERYPHQLSGGMQQRVASPWRWRAIRRCSFSTSRPPASMSRRRFSISSRSSVSNSTRRFCSSATIWRSWRGCASGPACSMPGWWRRGRRPPSSRRGIPIRSGCCAACHGRNGAKAWRGSTIPGLSASARRRRRAASSRRAAHLRRAPALPAEPALIDIGGRFSRCHYHALAGDLPRIEPALAAAPAEATAAGPILRIENLSKTYRVGDHALAALRDGVDLLQGETLGLVGESGSGKTTLARSLLGLTAADPQSRISMNGRTLPSRIGGRAPEDVKALQIVFQSRLGAQPVACGARLIGRAIAKLAGLGGGAAGAAARFDAQRAIARSLSAASRGRCPAGSSSGWQLRGPLPASPRWWCAMNRPRRSMCRCRQRSSICWPISK